MNDEGQELVEIDHINHPRWCQSHTVVNTSHHCGWATVNKHSGARYHLCRGHVMHEPHPADNDGETFQLLGLSRIYSLQTETRPPRRSSLDISRLQIHLVEMYSVNLSWIIQVRQESKNGETHSLIQFPNLLCIRLCPTTIQSILGLTNIVSPCNLISKTWVSTKIR